MKVTLAELNRLTGFSYPTIKRRVANLKPEKPPQRKTRGGGVWYESSDALKAIYAQNGTGDIVPGNEKLSKAELEAQLIEVKIQKEKIKVAAMEGELVSADAVRLRWGKIAAAFQRQALAFPDRCAQLLETAPDYKARVKIIKAEIEGLLTVLSKKTF